MPKLTIKPKEKGTIVEFGKLPLFTRSLTKKADMDNVVQIKVEGGYYVIERRPTPPSPLELALEKIQKSGNFSIVETSSETLETKEEGEPETSASFQEYALDKSNYQIGRDRFNRLKELGKSGELANCKNRLDICEKMGFEPKNNSTGYNWLSNQISKGYLEEELVRYNKQNSGEYAYRMTGFEPRYSGNKHIEEKAKPSPVKETPISNGLEKLGFVSLNNNPQDNKKVSYHTQRKRRVDYSGRPIEQGNMSLFEWLKSTDYLVYKLFVYGNGQVSMGKVVDYYDICLVFMEAGLEARQNKTSARSKGRSAQNVANMSIARLLAGGVLQKEADSEKGNCRYSLTMSKGGEYARGVYRTVSARSYDWDTKKGRVLHG